MQLVSLRKRQCAPALFVILSFILHLERSKRVRNNLILSQQYASLFFMINLFKYLKTPHLSSELAQLDIASVYEPGQSGFDPRSGQFCSSDFEML